MTDTVCPEATRVPSAGETIWRVCATKPLDIPKRMYSVRGTTAPTRAVSFDLSLVIPILPSCGSATSDVPVACGSTRANLYFLPACGSINKAAEALFEGSATLVAVTVMRCRDDTNEGARYNPLWSMLPIWGLIDHITD